MTGLVRQLKLHALVGAKAPMDGRAAIIVEFFERLFNGLIMEIIPEYNCENIVYHKNGKFYMEQSSNNVWLWCRGKGYWSFFESDLGLKYKEIQIIVKMMVEKHLKKKVGTLTFDATSSYRQVEEHLKKQVGTPSVNPSIMDAHVEEHIKKIQAATPQPRKENRCEKVEKHLKQLS